MELKWGRRMSYDLRFAVKAENGKYVDFITPDFAHPTYNIGNILRKAMGFDFNQGDYYRLSEIMEYLIKGKTELKYNAKAYRQYEPSNKWGTVKNARDSIDSILECVTKIVVWYEIPLEFVYFAW